MDRKRELTIAEHVAWEDFATLLEGVSPERMADPGLTADGWSVKDLLAHLACWMAEACCELERMAAGTYEERRLDVDAMNAEFLRAHRDQPLEVVWSEWHAARNRMLLAWDALPEVTSDAEEWFQESASKHFAEHADDVRIWIRSLHARG